MMKNYKKEIAKFLCGAEAFHSFTHAYFWLSGTTMTMFGITLSPMGSMAAAAINGLIAVLLGIYAWKPKQRT